MKRWRVLPCDQQAAKQLAESYGVSELMGVLLQSRGFTNPEQIDEAFGSQLTFSDPFLMADMEKATVRIWRAVNSFEMIAVYGDYDADGVTSTAMLYSYLESCGANVIYYIPDREKEGYGLNKQAIASLKEQGASLIVTVDNGVSSIEEIAYASELGMDTVVTDHHRPHASLPAACAVVDAYREDCQSQFKDFCGAGVVFKLIMAMEGDDVDLGGLLENYSDLVAIGTIADVVPLTGENRSFVRAGLRHIARTDRVGLRALLERAGLEGKQITSGSVTYGVVPRINATGRMGASGRAVQLLISEFPEEAEQLAEDICENNDCRRQIEQEIFEKAMEQLTTEPDRLYDRVIVVEGEDWHHGVIGIVSSRITERFGKPSIILSYSGEDAKGSGRSVEGFSLFEAVSACAPLLTRFGGHPMAAGLSLKTADLPRLRREINAYAARVAPVMPIPVLTLDCALKASALNVELPESLKLLEPFGMGNPAPLFGLLGAKLSDITPVGGGKHLRLTVVQDGYSVRCMRFGVSAEDFPYHVGEMLDLAVTLEAKEYNGKNTLSVLARDIRPASLSQEAAASGLALYEKGRRGELLAQEEYRAMLPSREDFALVYRWLRTQEGFSGGEELLYCRTGIPLEKLLLELDILAEHGLVTLEHFAGNLRVRMREAEKKVDLFDSERLRALAQTVEKEG